MAAISYVTTLIVGPGSPAGSYYLGVYGDAVITGTVCANCFCGAGAGGDSLWADGANPYIIPCNSCGICVNCVYASTVLTAARINVGGSSACPLYVVGNGVLQGTFEITYADTTCVCGSRLVKIPVGVNCY